MLEGEKKGGNVGKKRMIYEGGVRSIRNCFENLQTQLYCNKTATKCVDINLTAEPDLVTVVRTGNKTEDKRK